MGIPKTEKSFNVSKTDVTIVDGLATSAIAAARDKLHFYKHGNNTLLRYQNLLCCFSS